MQGGGTAGTGAVVPVAPPHPIPPPRRGEGGARDIGSPCAIRRFDMGARRADGMTAPQAPPSPLVGEGWGGGACRRAAGGFGGDRHG
jgi:hypothetical protein